MWLVFALASAVCAGLVSVLAKVGLQGVPSSVATAVRTVVVLLLAWALVVATGASGGIVALDPRTLGVLGLSGLTTGASWLFYFKALQHGRVTQVVAIDRSSLVLTALASLWLFGETQHLALKLAGLALITGGTYVVVRQLRDDQQGRAGASSRWLLWAGLSMLFAVLTTLLAKEGLHGVDSNLATALRTSVVLVMAVVLVVVAGERAAIRLLTRRGLRFLVLSGLATGASWLCFFRALQDGPVSIVLPVDKLSLLFASGFAYLVLREQVSRREVAGMAVILLGTLVLIAS